MKLNLLVIKTTQLEALKNQYEAIGINFEYHNHGRGPFHYSAKTNGIVFEIYPLPYDRKVADDTTRLGFLVPELEPLMKKFEAAEWKIISPPKETEWGMMAVIKDLDGRRIEVVQE